jgi:hypothetical protein
MEKPGGTSFRAYSFYDRLHGNIARCVMLTRQHRSPKDRENLPYHERVQGERTSVPSSGLGTDPHATAHRGGMVLRATETASRLIAGAARLSPNSISEKRSDHAMFRPLATRRAFSFNHP